MTYEQSLQNIENIKNFILPYGDCIIFFDFKIANSFEIVFFTKSTYLENDKLRADALNRNCPHALIKNDKNDLPVLSYIDNNITLNFNIGLNETVQFHSKKTVDNNKLKNELMSLIKQLKNT